MHRITLCAVTLLTLGASAVVTAPAQAETNYPWCAYLGGHEQGGTNCGFSTRAQCEATISGIGGYCDRNPAYRPGRSTDGRSRR